MIFQVAGLLFALKAGSKWVLNRIIDAEGVRKPLGRHLGRYHSALRANLALLDHSWSALGAFQEGRADAGRDQGELKESSVRIKQWPGEG